MDPDATIIFGATLDEQSSSGEVHVTVLATGFDAEYQELSATSQQSKPLPPRRPVISSHYAQQSMDKYRSNKIMGSASPDAVVSVSSASSSPSSAAHGTIRMLEDEARLAALQPSLMGFLKRLFTWR